MSPFRPIPRLLLRLQQQQLQIRLYSAPRLAKPTKFTPPSHPARRPAADPINYPGPPVAQNAKKQYPETMPPPDTWAHWALTSRHLHFYLSLSILFVLAGTVSVSNFVRTDRHARELEWDWGSPVKSLAAYKDAWKRSVEERSDIVKEIRKRHVEDVEKRGEFRRVHGLEEVGNKGGFGGFGVKEDHRVKARRKEGEGWVEVQMTRAEEEALVAAGVVGGAEEVVGGGEGEGKKPWWKW